MQVPAPGAAKRLLRPVLHQASGAVAGAKRAETVVHDFSVRRSVFLLRISLGFVFIVFGFLKFFPGLSPAQKIAEQTTAILTFHLVPVSGLLFVVAFVEVLAGILLIQGRYMRAVVWLLVFEMLAILSPLVTLPGELFNGPHHLPSLLGQYILKDLVLFSGVLVLAAHTREGRIVLPAEERPDVASAAPTAPATGGVVVAPARTPAVAVAAVPAVAATVAAPRVATPRPTAPGAASRHPARRPAFVRAQPARPVATVRDDRPARTSPLLTATAFVAVGLLAVTSRSISPSPSR